MTAAETFTDAQALHRAQPDAFDVPTAREIAALRHGDAVKVCAGRERFWVQVEGFDDRGGIVGSVANDLLFTGEHGPDFGDEIRLERRHIFEIEPRASAA